MVGVGEDVGAVLIRDFADEDGLHTATASEAHVAGAVANHHRAGEVDVGIVGLGLHRQSCFGLAAGAAAAGEVGAYIYISNVQPVAFHNIQQVTVHLVHISLCTEPLGNTLLVRDDENFTEVFDY